jgi:hypothetical protein
MTKPSATTIVSSQTQRLSVNVSQPLVLLLAALKLLAGSVPPMLSPNQAKKNMTTNSAIAPPATSRSPVRRRLSWTVKR